MSIFGQVWLWSLLAFVVGALISWLVLARPMRRRVQELEERLATAHADAARTPANAGASRTALLSPVGDETSAWTREEPRGEQAQPAGRGFDPESEYEAEYRTAPEQVVAEPATPGSAFESTAFDDADEAFARPEHGYPDAERTTVTPSLAALDGPTGDPGHGDPGFSGNGRSTVGDPHVEESTVDSNYGDGRTTVYSGLDGAEESGVDAGLPGFPGVDQSASEIGVSGSEPGVPASADSGHSAVSGRFAEEEAGAESTSESFAQRAGHDPDYRAAATDYLNPAESGSGYHRVADTPSADEYGSGYHRAPEPSALERRLEPSPVGFDGGPSAPDEPVSLFEPTPHQEPEAEPDWFRRPDLPERSPFEEPADGHLAEPAETDHLNPAGSGHEQGFVPPDAAEVREQGFASTDAGGGREQGFVPTEAGGESASGLVGESASDSADRGGESAFESAGNSPGQAGSESIVDSADGTQLLPKRQPRDAPRGGFDPPRPIQPSMRPIERRGPELSGTQSGSLFEPSVQPNQSAPEPPPARGSGEEAVPPGPFGPGSAMPRPGGGRPAEGYTVKASVTALRYCTEESPQFPRMVAEVWFRSAADAERVGFRPLH
ncbi:sunset domain-containing protein [Amycolatopsis jiangsuensis]|uniref:Uncharacterized protein n=1 Tax=Amycolatopsis jiangsuensis TaxID=1181879 RepID=A0A840IVH8_9PSEU|nr:hypothetical protein [Amycolatopsis jiangsuensis]